MSNERIEMIKSLHNNDEEVHQFDIDWLIEQAEKVEELISLNLWSARRLKTQQYKDFAYDELEKITVEKHERL